MRLRRLRSEDAPYMLEWMHDQSVTQWMDADFASKTIDDCICFIENSETDTDIHKAIADDNTDQYMGTVSLKHISLKESTAEFAITIRKEAMGKGYSRQAMTDMIRFGMEKLGLQIIYWYVNQANIRALRFYDKNGYQRVDTLPVDGLDSGKYVFYCVQKEKK